MNIEDIKSIAKDAKIDQNKLYGFVILQLFIPGGLGSIALFFLQQVADRSYFFIGLGLLALALVSAIIGQVVRFRLGKEQLHVTSTQSGAEQSITLLKLSYDEIEKARASFKEAIAEQRIALKEQREDFFVEIKETRDHYEEKEKELRQGYHDRLNKAAADCREIHIENIRIRMSLRNAGITLTENFEIIIPKETNHG